MGQWVVVPPETVQKVYDLTGGYPWLVQTTVLPRRSGQPRRRVVITPEDADIVTHEVLCNDLLFSFWWPTDQ